MPARVNADVPGEEALAKKLGERIRALREKKGLTQTELGSSPKGVVYFAKQHVWKMETGVVTPTLPALAHFAKRLGTTIAALVKGL